MLELQLCAYRAGDLARVQTDEPDPYPNWAAQAEQQAHDLRSIRLGDVLVCAFGYSYTLPGVVEAFAVIDRRMVRGHGRMLAKLVRERTAAWMAECGIHRVTATCAARDKAAQAFLRATGHTRECILEAAGADQGDLAQFKIVRRSSL